MDIKALFNENEKPLDNLVSDGGFCAIFRTIGCIGDSLSSGEFESTKEDGTKGYNDLYEYSWGQYMARMMGSKVYNFSRGGMTAEWYWDSWAEENGCWDEDKLCQAYIIALGVNDVSKYGKELGDISDIDLENPENSKDTFVGYYGRIILRLKKMQPYAKFFIMTMPDDKNTGEKGQAYDLHRELLYKMAELFDRTYVLDFRKYSPVHDDEFREKFLFGGHFNAMGYILTAKMTASYIDYIVRHNMKDFMQVPFIGTDMKNNDYER